MTKREVAAIAQALNSSVNPKGQKSTKKMIDTQGNKIYECGICDCYHPWEFDGDCRDDANRYGSPEEYAEHNDLSIYDIAIHSMEDLRLEDLRRERGEDLKNGHS